jgi:hypothetical protein
MFPLKNLIGKVVVFVCLFFYLYSIPFRFIPLHIGSRVVLGIAGFIILIFQIVKEAETKKDIFIAKDIVVYVSIFALIVFFSLISIFFNDTRDLEFVTYPISLCLILLAAYFIHFIVKKTYRVITYETIMNLIVIAVLVQVLLALSSFLSPAINNFLISLQSINELEASKIEQTMSLRLVGFGSTFFGAGLINGFALMIIAVLIKKRDIRYSRILFLSFAFLAIFVLGMMMARTTIIGFILAIGYLVTPTLYFKIKMIKNKLRFFLSLIFIPVFAILLLSVFAPKLMNSLSVAASFGFEMFINYYQHGEVSTESTDVLQSMYIFPNNAKTYLIGDGHFYLQPGNEASGYYMRTDVGYLRLIYYFGITGMFCYFLLQFAVVQRAIAANRLSRELKHFLLLSFLFCLIVNFKGLADMFFLIALFCYPFVHKISTEYDLTGTNISPRAI